MTRYVYIFGLITTFFVPYFVYACFSPIYYSSIPMLLFQPFFIVIFFIPLGFLLVFRLVRKKYSSAVKLQTILKIATFIAFLPLFYYIIFLGNSALDSYLYPTPPDPRGALPAC